jgi:hypothetical protein
VIGAASLIGEVVYYADLKTTSTHAVDAASGDVIWRFKDGAYNPVISDGKRLYLTGYKRIYALKMGHKKGKGQSKKGRKKGGKKG